ncbi:DUF4062 domain-containing protein [Mycetocola sp. 2940]|uniref:ATP-binding protein n=1 Tax=Mycetocola sp. 2940 TaxID=3156452 RepID=UPI003397EF8A
MSSTLKELAPERQAARSAIERLHLAPVMFELGARPHPPRRLYRAYLEQSDVFVGLYWERYGWVAPGEEVSGLEDEYNLSGDLPKLIYIKEPVGAREARLKELLDRVRDDDGTSFKYFSTARELKKLLEADLATLLAERFAESRSGPAGGPDTARANAPLPSPLTGLIGRDADVEAVEALLARESVRLVTLTGPGGIGKTRLAIAVAARYGHRTDEETAFVDLSTLDDPSLVPQAIADAVGVSNTGDEPLEAKLKSALRPRRMTMILDNFEVVRGAGPMLAPLLSAAPGLKVLVTSRMRLHVSSEYIFDVGPLALPPAPTPGEAATTPDSLLDSPAVALFVERARAVKPDFELTAENSDAVASICIAVDGVPLALELAAARVRVLAPKSLLAHLDRRLSLLADSASDRPPRQQTLRSTIEWSTQQLSDGERTLLAELGVFSGLFALDAVEAVSQSSVDADLLARMDSLVDNSLVREHDRGGLSYFSLLATVREYALERLEAGGNLQTTLARHAAYYVAWGDSVEVPVEAARQREWMSRIEDTHDNVRAAVRFLLDNRDWEAAMHLAWSLRFYAWIALLHGEVSAWTDEVLASGDDLSPRTRAIAINCTWGVALMRSPNEAAVTAFTECVDLFHAAGDVNAEGLGRVMLATAMMLTGTDGARIDDQLSTSLRLLRDTGDTWGQMSALVSLGQVSMMNGNIGRALEQFEEGVDLARRHEGGGYVTAYAIVHLAWAKFSVGDIAAATDLFTESLTISASLQHAVGVAHTLDGLVAVAVADGDPQRAGRLLGSSENVWKRLGQLNVRAMSLGRFLLDQVLADVDMAGLAAARTEGSAMSLEEIIAYALADRKPADTVPAASVPISTRRPPG